MLSIEHSRNNTFSDCVLKNCLLHSITSTHFVSKEREETKGMNEQKLARRHSKEGGNHLKQENVRLKTMENIDGGLQPAVDGQSLNEVK